MLRAIYVDDEIYNHVLLRELLKQRTDITLIETFSNGYEALSSCHSLKPDIAFIDIEMPGMSGLELAVQMQEANSSLDVVFITAFRQYAIDAFRVNAVDYLMKPIDSAELNRVVTKLNVKRRSAEEVLITQEENMPQIIVLGRNGIKMGDVYKDLRWSTHKVKEAFSYLLLKNDVFVDKWILCDLLWPEAEEDKASVNLHTTIYRLKATLKESGLPVQIISGNGGYKLDLGPCSADFILFSKAVRKLEKGYEYTIEELEAIAAMYEGDLFAGGGYLWAMEAEENLRNQYMSLLYKIAEKYRSNQVKKAIETYKKITAAFPYEDKAVLEIAALYHQIGEYKELRAYYAHYQQILKSQLDDVPSQKVKQAFLGCRGTLER